MTTDLGTTELLDEVDRQAKLLHDLGYPALAGLDAGRFDAMVDRLRGRVRDLDDPLTVSPEVCAPALLVVAGSLVPTTAAVARWQVKGRAGWTDMADELAGYQPIEGVDLPGEPVYLLMDVRTGADTLGVTPNDALPRITAAGRTPLTIDEGVALVTQRPRVFEEHNAFQALASRADNKRVPSFWMSKGAPRLGWCWAGNPHSWLGAASAARRV